MYNQKAEPGFPHFFYGTAWKELETQRLTLQALEAGFRAIDTANQRKHYFEQAVGQAVIEWLQKGHQREELFIQTKFTFKEGQDQRLPYDPRASIKDQVRQSFESSLGHFSTPYIDSFVLHGPSTRGSLQPIDYKAWAAMETLVDEGRVRFLGLSNINLTQLDDLFRHARIKPTFVQNRCFAVDGWDREIRTFCRANEIKYQGFSLLTANIEWITRPVIQAMARRHQKTLPQIVFRFCFQEGMIVLTGTSNAQHMRDDLTIFDFELSAEEMSELGSKHSTSVAG